MGISAFSLIQTDSLSKFGHSLNMPYAKNLNTARLSNLTVLILWYGGCCAGRSIVLCGVSNVILHNFQISTVGESDTVHIFAGSSKVWVDHVTSTDAKLGLVSVLQGSTDVTISNCHLSNYNFNQLLGASDFDKEDADMRVSVYRNWFKDSMQRMPHCR